jgi:hypothetical protein
MNAVRLLVALLVAASLFSTFARAIDELITAEVDQKYVQHHAELMHKVRSLIIPKVDWKDVTFRQALKDIAPMCQAADPTHQGIHFTLDPTIARRQSLYRVTYKGENKPLIEILRQLGKFRVTGGDVHFFYDSGKGGDWEVFYVPPNYFKIGSENAVKGVPGVYGVASQLAAKGAELPAGATALYFPDREKLSVGGSYEIVESVDELLNP